MRTVYKYGLNPGYNSFSVPYDSKIVHVDEQYGQLYAWIEVNSDQVPGYLRQFNVYGTGHYITNVGDTHIASVVMTSGLVWHVYENIAN
jgi:hypothetical protein